VSQNTSAQGAKSVDVVLDALNGKSVPKEVIVEQVFIDKGSVAKYLK
jgi:ABC-type sugar transport system substrate-binding protein